jgi:predicted RNA-binding Zn-ribbon protein involved in translation (DUF1610 family)
MPLKCDHNIPETLKGTGRCDIRWEVHKRNGQPKWWCRTHGLDASAPDGAALEACRALWFDAVPLERQIDIQVGTGELAVWGCLPPTIPYGPVPAELGKVHVHHRPGPGQHKDLDGSYDIVRLRHGDSEVVVEGMAAVARSISELSGRSVVTLVCPRCGSAHIDELRFATYPHRKHQCNACGRDFWDTQPSISNPLAAVHETLGLPPASAPVRPDRALDLHVNDYGAVALWPSNSAILSTMSRPEEVGIHVHAWNARGNLVLDETYSPLSIDGIGIDEAALRCLAVQKSLAHGVPVLAMACMHCGSPLLSPLDGWVEPATTHLCASCGGTSKTRRRVFLNPLAEKPARYRLGRHGQSN